MKNTCAKKKSSRGRRTVPINPLDVTAVILTRNEERNLERAAGSLPRGMPVLVIDHESSDRTPDLARSLGATVIVREFDGFVNARRFALSQVRTPWTLMLDADEALDATLRDAIVAAPEDFDAYAMLRTTFYCGRALRMWRGERLLRLFKTSQVRLEAAPAAGGDAQLHERWTCDGATATLPGTLLHYSYPTAQAYREKFERYTSVESHGVLPSRKTLLAEWLRTPLRFAWYAFVRGAALDGTAGLQVAWWSARYPADVQRKALRR